MKEERQQRKSKWGRQKENKKLRYGRGTRDTLVSIEKSLQSMNDLDINPRSSHLLLLNGHMALVDKLGRFQHIKPEVEIEQRIFISNI